MVLLRFVYGIVVSLLIGMALLLVHSYLDDMPFRWPLPLVFVMLCVSFVYLRLRIRSMSNKLGGREDK